MKKYWTAFILQRGFKAFLYLVWRKIFSCFIKYRFNMCKSLMLCGDYQINGYKYITIGKLSVGDRFRMEAISNVTDEIFTPKIVIGYNVSFGTDVHIGCINHLTIGNNVLCGSHVCIIDHDHGCYSDNKQEHSSPDEPPSSRKMASEPIHIGDNVHIGDGVIILKSVRIGSGTVIGAGSVVTKSISSNSLAVGNPAKTIKHYDKVAKRWVGVIDTFGDHK